MIQESRYWDKNDKFSASNTSIIATHVDWMDSRLQKKTVMSILLEFHPTASR